MLEKLTYRKATINDLRTIINLLLEDDLSQTRESKKPELDQAYIDAFHRIDANSNQYLMVVENGKEIVGTCHLTIMPSLTFTGQTRMQIEAVRVIEKYRGQKIGEWMIQKAIQFKASHEGMKIYFDKTI
jgi:N-acetylglutamate synthase-like GNAT family acetyltransferase